MNYTLVDENVPLVADGIVLEIMRRNISSPQYFIGLTAEEPINRIPGGGETGVDALGKLWDTFHERKPGIRGLKPEGDELGVAHPGKKEGYYRYFAVPKPSVESAEGYTLGAFPKANYRLLF